MLPAEGSLHQRPFPFAAKMSRRARCWSAVLLLLFAAAAWLTVRNLQSHSTRDVVTRVYDVRDLIIEVPNFVPPDSREQRPAPPQRTPQQIIRDITTMLTSSIDPLSWQSNTGKLGSIRELNGQLIIAQ